MSMLLVGGFILAAAGNVAASNTVYDSRIINQDGTSWIVASSNEVISVATGDWDGNGIVDTAYSFDFSGQFLIRVVTPDGAILASKSLPYPANDIAMGDFNADGKAEMIFTRSCTGALAACAYVWYSNGNSFLVYQSDEYIEVAIGDWNHDGKADTGYTMLLAGTRYIKVDDPDGVNLFRRTEPRPIYTLAMGDVNSDVYAELVFSTNQVPSTANIINHDGSSSQLKSSDVPMAVAIGNWDNVGKLDSAYSWTSSGVHYAIIEAPDGSNLLSKTMCDYAWRMAFGNVNGDSRQELLYSDVQIPCS